MEDIKKKDVSVGILMSHPLTHPPDNMAQQQLEDDCIKPVYLAVKSGNFPLRMQ